MLLVASEIAFHFSEKFIMWHQSKGEFLGKRLVLRSDKPWEALFAKNGSLFKEKMGDGN